MRNSKKKVHLNDRLDYINDHLNAYKNLTRNLKMYIHKCKYI